MNATRLLAHFDRLSEAPGAVPRLRRFILDLAVRGKLVPQDVGDEPAGELLKRIQVEKARLVKAGKLKRVAEETANDFDVPFMLPKQWVWAQLGDVAQYGIPDKADSNAVLSENTWVLDLEDIEKDTSRLLAHVELSVRPFNSTKTVFKQGDVLFGKLRPYLNKVVIADRDGVCTTEIIPIRGYCGLVPEYTQLVLRSPLTMARVDRLMYGVKMPRLGTADATALSYPLPPLAEQHRIVAKVDELMALCDQLEAAQQERERRRDRLAAASLQRLNQPAADTTPEAQREHARFHLHHLPRLTTRPEHIKAMRQTVRGLAICGRLVPQDVRDGTASEFLLKVEEDRGRLAKAGEIGAAKPLEPIALDTTPFPLPSGWEWARFGKLINHSDAGISPKTEGFSRSGDHWGVLKVSAVSWDRFKPEENKQLLEGLVPPDFAHVQAGDFLISRANTRELVAKCVIVDEKPVKLILSDKTVRLRLASLGNPRFWCLVNNHAEYARAYYANEASGTSDSMKNVSRPIIYNLLIPIPPLAEQHRIVARVDELMALCDQLEAQLTITQTDSRRLLEAVLEVALVPS